ncbi:MAG: flippase-like domain-containing protein [Deltaproteobacteria bacterium]|jgi:uncharacterized membrane protein YbhN (UPF0104 family)|nr:flippase-like domain-containing protein [Deltaproteobacteria bacterium]
MENGGTRAQNGDKGEHRGLRSAISLIIAAIFILAIAIYVYFHLGEFKEILQRGVPKAVVASMAGSIFLTYMVNARILRKAVLIHKVRLPVIENISLTYATSALNYFMPLKGAVGLRAIYLKRRFNLPLTDFVSQLMVVAVITLVVSAAFALLGLLALGGRYEGRAATLVGVYFALVLVLGSSAMILGRLKIKLPQRLMDFVISWNRYLGNPGILLEIVALDIIYYLLWSLTNWLALSAFQVTLSPAEAFFYTSLQIHALIINLTPAGLGVVEAMGVFAGSILDFSPATALLAQGLSRVMAMGVLCLFGILGWAHLSIIKKDRQSVKDV